MGISKHKILFLILSLFFIIVLVNAVSAEDIGSAVSLNQNVEDVTPSDTEYDFNDLRNKINNGVNGGEVFLGNATYQTSFYNSVYVFKNLTIYGGNNKFDDKTSVINANNKSSVFVISSDCQVSFLNIIICNTKDSYGSAIHSYSNSSLNLIGCTFINNEASRLGGSIYSSHNSNLNIVNCSFTNNKAQEYGGSIACDDLNSVRISGSEFSNSVSVRDAGGALYIKYCPDMDVNNCKFINCSARFGGAICCLSSNGSIINSLFENNTAKFDGGAVYLMYGTNIIGGNFLNNIAINGGGLFSDASSSVSFTDSYFNKNHANNYGGAMFFNAGDKINTNNVQFGINTARIDNQIHHQKNYDYIIGNNNYTLVKGDFSNNINLPSYYNLSDYGYVSSVKNQKGAGVCWAFTAMAVLETCIAKITNQIYDFSEANLKNLAEIFSAYGWKARPNKGNYFNAVFGYLASWLGPIDEKNDVYSDKNVLSPVLNSLFHIQNIYYIPEKDGLLDLNAIKQAIMSYGAVGIVYNSDSEYYNNYYKSYYCPEELSIDHAVTIVGWDDNFSKNNFNTPAPGDGAFIVKNSWDDDWGNNGYFYLSYYDKTAFNPSEYNPAFTFILNDTQRFNRNYQYDICGVTAWFNTRSYNAIYENIFNSTTNDYLTAFSTYFNQLTNYTASIYVNNKLVLNQSGCSSNIGYETIYLKEMIPLKVGDTFKISLSVSAKNTIKIPLMDYDSSVLSFTRLISSPGISYAYYNGYKRDLYNSPYLKAHSVACIKAFTTSLNTNIIFDDVSINLDNPYLSVTVFDQFGNEVKEGVVNFTINGTSYLVNVENGKALFSGFDKVGIYDVNANYIGPDYYYESFSHTTVTVVEDVSILISAENNFYGENLILNINSKDIFENYLDLPLTVTFNGKSYNIKTEEGKYSLKIYDSLNIGKYIVKVNFSGNDLYNPYNTTFEVSILYKTSIKISTEVNNKNIEVTINSNFNGEIKIYMDTIDFKTVNVVKGINTFDFSDLNPGLHKLFVEFIDKQYYLPCNDSTEFFIKFNPNLSMLIENNQIKIESNTKTVDVYINNIYNSTLTVINGVVYFNLNLNIGKYLISVKYDEDDNYIDQIISKEYVVNKHTSEIKLNKIEINNLNAIIDFETNFNSPVMVYVDNKYFNTTNIYHIFLSGLNAGQHNVSIYFAGNNYYDKVNKTFTFDILKLKANITINNVNIVGFNAKIKFNTNFNDSVSVYINNKYYGNFENEVNFSNLAPDKYQAMLSFSGNDYYDSIYEQVNFEIVKFNSTITIVESIVDGFNARIKFNANFNDSVSVYLDEKWQGDCNDGIVNLNNLTPGNHNINLIFKGNDFYTAVNCVSNLIVDKIDSVLNVVYDNSTIIIKSNVEGSADIYVNNEFYTRLNIVNGTASLNLDNKHGKVTVKIENNKFYTDIEKNITIVEDNKQETKIIAKDIIMKYGDGTRFYIQLLDKNDNPLAKFKVNININGMGYDRTTNDEGKASIAINLNSGIYKVLIQYAGSDIYQKSNASYFVTIKPNMIGCDVVKIFRNATPYAVKLVDKNDNPLANTKLKININGVFYNRTTNSDGNAYLNLNLGFGKYVLTVIGPNNEMISNNIVILANMHGNDVVKYFRNGTQYKIKLLDDHGNIAANTKVTFNINGVFYTRTSNSEGIATLNINLAPGKYILTAIYNEAMISNGIVVLSNILSKNIKMTTNSRVPFIIKTLNGIGKPISGEKVEFNINGVIYTRTSDINGTAKLNINLMKGVYIITTYYNGLSTSNRIMISEN